MVTMIPFEMLVATRGSIKEHKSIKRLQPAENAGRVQTPSKNMKNQKGTDVGHWQKTKQISHKHTWTFCSHWFCLDEFQVTDNKTGGCFIWLIVKKKKKRVPHLDLFLLTLYQCHSDKEKLCAVYRKLSTSFVWNTHLKCIHESLEFISMRTRNVLRVSFHEVWWPQINCQRVFVWRYYHSLNSCWRGETIQRGSVRVLQALF